MDNFLIAIMAFALGYLVGRVEEARAALKHACDTVKTLAHTSRIKVLAKHEPAPVEVETIKKLEKRLNP